ncbi:LytR/AlgR family response regulator transcription factor [Cesiribacter andamanensis]|uniref:Sensory transduction protein lytR n=1 Tax=Cesiribacter andamanensis AMV16 TaxID=1279009 RepID=M7N2I3_9BACT|nr:response regulator [Cesiribacter andamanensis]EMR01512.1 Sensory transduction protein lytR [Cesiribacter andamanensis AMV16]
MKHARIYIVEDDYVVAKNLSFLLESLAYTVLGISETGEEGLLQIQKEKPDLVVLDIDLAGQLNGIEVGKKLKEQLHIPFIYVTAHADDATMAEALPTEPWAYLAKPFNENTLRSSIELALYKSHQLQHGPSPAAAEGEMREKKYTLDDSIFIKSKNRLVKVALRDILFVEANDIYANVYTADTKYLVNYTLKAIAEKFPEAVFRRVHRSYLVNQQKVEALEYNDLIIGGHKIPIGKTYRDDLMQNFDVM